MDDGVLLATAGDSQKSYDQLMTGAAEIFEVTAENDCT